MASFTYYNQFSRCPICGGKTGDCRKSADGLQFCHERHGRKS
jgi:hypothetical protein